MSQSSGINKDFLLLTTAFSGDYESASLYLYFEILKAKHEE
jgi:hypothetical protein